MTLMDQLGLLAFYCRTEQIWLGVILCTTARHYISSVECKDVSVSLLVQ